MNRNSPLTLKQNWKALWASSSQRSLTLVGSVLVAIILCGMPPFFQTIEHRQGIELNDIILTHVPAHNVSSYIFLIIWGMGLLTLIRAIQQPLIYTKYVWLYIAICITRIITITLVPLAAPVGLVELVDPITGVFYGHATITKDLFFSGHTATLLAMYCVLPKRWDRILSLIAACTVACLLLVQHVHYSVDILGAFVFVFVINKILNSTLFLNHQLQDERS